MDNILFPKDYINRRYAKIHIKFIIDYLEFGGAKISMVDVDDENFSYYGDDKNSLILSLKINEKRFIINYSDHPSLDFDVDLPNVPIFRFHYYRELHDKLNNVFPIGPMLVYNSQKIKDIKGLGGYFNFRNNFEYEPGDKIANIQSNIKRPSILDSYKRRLLVRNILEENLKSDEILKQQVTQKTFWNLHRNCLVSICVPGASNDMLDRGQYELMGLGVCTISPELKTILPWNKDLIGGVHYISCNYDYSDLLDKINWCKENKNVCKEIGNNAKKLFSDYCIPENYLNWIKQTVGDFYEKGGKNLDSR
jgi:hypothetical protein